MPSLGQVLSTLQAVASELLKWLAGEFTREPVAWLALILTLLFGVANYKLARAKWLGEQKEKKGKVFSVKITAAHGLYDLTAREKKQGRLQERIGKNSIPRFISTRLNLDNQTAKIVLVHKIDFQVVCEELDSHICFKIQTEHLPKEQLSAYQGQVVFSDVLTKKAVVVSQDNLYVVEPNSTKVLDAVIFIPEHTEVNMAEAPSEALRVDANVRHSDGVATDSSALGISQIASMWSKGIAETSNEFSEFEMQYQHLLEAGLEFEKTHPAVQIF